MTQEEIRLSESGARRKHWKRWGPYLSERAWGTVREDYSPYGNAWEYFPHDHARSRAYRWNEDGLAGICDRHQTICFALALWNGRDPILKERLFGLTGNEGNHGEDVKEYYFYLDSTPTHSYMKYLYKYPQAEFPYEQLVEENRQRGKNAAGIRTARHRRLRRQPLFRRVRRIRQGRRRRHPDPDHGREPRPGSGQSSPAADGVVPQHLVVGRTRASGPSCTQAATAPNPVIELNHRSARQALAALRRLARAAVHRERDQRAAAVRRREPYALCEGRHQRLRRARRQGRGESGADRHQGRGALSTRRSARARPSVVRLRLADSDFTGKDAFAGFDKTFALRQREADEFYATVIPQDLSPDAQNVMRQGFAGMLWSKQFYHYVVKRLAGRRSRAIRLRRPSASNGRNHEWTHLYNADVISMPDKWEYPWYAAWDLAFHCVPLALVDSEFAKEQLMLMLREWYMHPNGQIPAYEWAFGDVNPPVHAWAAWRVYKIDKKRRGKGDRAFLERVFHKLLLNFTWWVNRKDAEGMNIFQGGFLGLDNIGVFDRSAPLPTGGYIEQSDGTSWMAMYMPESAGDRAGTGQRRSVLRGRGQQILGALPLHRQRHEPSRRRRHGPVERGRRLLLRRAALARRQPVPDEDPLHGRADPAVRGGNAGAGGARPAAGLQAAPGMVHRESPGPDGERGLHATPRAWASAGCCRSPTPTNCAAFCKFMLDEHEFLSPYGIRALSQFHATILTCSRSTAWSIAWTTSPANHHRPVRRQFQLARARSGSR